jgi:hypothetical protein
VVSRNKAQEFLLNMASGVIQIYIVTQDDQLLKKQKTKQKKK